MSLPSIYGRDLPPTDDLLDQWVELYDTIENRMLLAREMAAMLADAVEMPERYERALAQTLDGFLDAHVAAEDRVRMMARTATVSHNHHGGGIDTIVPLFEQFVDEER